MNCKVCSCLTTRRLCTNTTFLRWLTAPAIRGLKCRLRRERLRFRFSAALDRHFVIAFISSSTLIWGSMCGSNSATLVRVQMCVLSVPESS